MSKNTVAIVTGGANGLGFIIAKHLVDHGIEVNIFDKDELALKKLPNVFSKFVVDVTNKTSVLTALNSIMDTAGKIDVLINNAGIIHSCPLFNMTEKINRVHDFEKYKEIINVNLHSVFLVGSLVVERMISKRTKGTIINISSICADGNAGQSAYSAAKAGVNAITKSWAKELGPLGIRVVAIAPGFMNTSSTQSAINSSTINHIQKKTPLRSLGNPQYLAELVVSVISNQFLTGEIINLHGGLTL